MQTTNPSRVFRTAAEAAIEDYLSTGMNVYIGGGKPPHLTDVMTSIATTLDANKVVDSAFVCTSRAVKALCEEMDFPSDLSVNLKQGVDLFIAPAASLDENCNVILDSDTIAADRYAAEIAEKVVVIVHEDDVRDKPGMLNIPVQLVNFLPEEAAKSLCSKQFLEAGVRGASLRTDGSCIADLSVSSDALLKRLDDELKALPSVVAVGLLPASTKVTAVVATSTMLPFDMTSSLSSMAELAVEKRKKALEGGSREKMLRENVNDWNVVTEEEREALVKEFSFTNAEGAEAYVRYVHYMSRSVGHHPEINHVYKRVRISLMTFEANGITELDTMFARELSSAYRRMNAGGGI